LNLGQLKVLKAYNAIQIFASGKYTMKFASGGKEKNKPHESECKY